MAQENPARAGFLVKSAQLAYNLGESELNQYPIKTTPPLVRISEPACRQAGLNQKVSQRNGQKKMVQVQRLESTEKQGESIGGNKNVPGTFYITPHRSQTS